MSTLQKGRRSPEAQPPPPALVSENAVAARAEGLLALGFVVGLVVAHTLWSSAPCNLQPPFGRSADAAPALKESGPFVLLSVCPERVWPRAALGRAHSPSETHARAGTVPFPGLVLPQGLAGPLCADWLCFSTIPELQTSDVPLGSKQTG